MDAMPYPENVENHFVVDPFKFDFYAMACYRQVGEGDRARKCTCRCSCSSAYDGCPQLLVPGVPRFIPVTYR